MLIKEFFAVAATAGLLAGTGIEVFVKNETHTGFVAQITDGDTFILATALKNYRVRLHGIDAPELRQTCRDAREVYPCGVIAATALTDAVLGRDVTCLFVSTSYDRVVGRCSTTEGGDLSEFMLKSGYSYAVAPYATKTDHMLQDAARRRGLGFWREPFEENFEPPWQFRKRSK
jgi:endonuclease YncB( thermonuclease family)